MNYKKKKVLFIMHIPPPVHGASMMGKYIYDSTVINSEFDCIYINLSASQKVTEIGQLGFKKIFFLVNNFFDILKTVLKEKPNLCYVTPSSWDWGFYRDFLLIMFLKLLNCKIVVHFHNKAVDSWAKRPFNKFLYRIFFKNLKVILLAEELYAEKEPYVERSNLFICPNGIKKTINVPKENNQTSNQIVSFLFLSNMMEEKGIWTLFDACKILKEKGYQFKCDFVGNWSDITEYDFNARMISIGLNNYIKAHGPQYGDSKKPFFEKADVFVFPTFYHGETFGLVLLEAMEYGLPCISTLEGGIPSVVKNNETGFLVEPKSSIDLANKMIVLIENAQLRVGMGIAGRIRFEQNFTLEIFEKKLASIINECF